MPFKVFNIDFESSPEHCAGYLVKSSYRSLPDLNFWSSRRQEIVSNLIYFLWYLCFVIIANRDNTPVDFWGFFFHQIILPYFAGLLFRIFNRYLSVSLFTFFHYIFPTWTYAVNNQTNCLGGSDMMRRHCATDDITSEFPHILICKKISEDRGICHHCKVYLCVEMLKVVEQHRTVWQSSSSWYG